MARNSQFPLVVALSALAIPAFAQIDLDTPRDPTVIRMDVDLVNLLCTVRDKSGNYVKDLSKGDFVVLDDGRRQPITSFAREVDTPLTVAVLLDVSGSVRNVWDQETAAANHFFTNVLRPGDRAMLVGFAQYVMVWQDLTSSRAFLSKALAERAGPMDPVPGAPAHGGTLLRDAVKLVASQKLVRLPGRKVMVLITDGEDNGSRVGLDNAIQAAQASDTVIYGIHYEDAGMSYGGGMRALESMTGPTGGRTFHVDKKWTFEKAFAAIEDEMRNQYAVGYPLPDKSDIPAFHKVDVKVAKSGLKVQTRNGYYAVPK